MASVGERLRLERESRSKTIEDLVEATHIDRRYLEALERGEVDALPGRAFGKLYIRAYADLLGFEPQPLIEAYDLEHRGPPDRIEEPAAPTRPVETAVARWRAEKIAERAAAAHVTAAAATDPEPLVPAEPELVPELEPAPRAPHVPVVPLPVQRRLPRRALAISGLAVVGIGAWLVFAPRSERAPAPVEPPRAQATPPPSPRPTPTPVPSPPPGEPGGHLSVSDFGVGQRVVHKRLEGRTDQFALGEVAWFQTQVQGARSGDTVRHVWLHDGRAVYSVELPLGGRSWRTHSRARLGRAGPWTIEARDEEGRVLASTTIRCE
jgi:transcriptional regulator with XRE-family HTH domain